MLAFRHHNPTVLYYGRGQLEDHLASEVMRFGRRVLLVYGGGSVKRSGLYARVMALLRDGSIQIVELSGVEPNPRLTTVRRGIELCQGSGVDLVLAIGGGSVVDCAKAVAIGACYAGDVWDFFAQPGTHEATGALPLGVILTLPAAGSEVNPGTVITNWDTREKLGARSPLMFPRFSFCDPQTTCTLPYDQTVIGICDILSHCLENYFHPTTNTLLQQHLLEALMKTILEATPKVLAAPDNYDARETIMYCGTMALDGLITMGIQGDWASHAIEHEISALYDIPHGAGMAIVLPHWMDYVLDTSAERFANLGIRVFGLSPQDCTVQQLARQTILELRAFFQSVGVPARLSHYGVEVAALQGMAGQCVRFGAIGHFRELGADDVYEILRRAL